MVLLSGKFQGGDAGRGDEFFLPAVRDGQHDIAAHQLRPMQVMAVGCRQQAGPVAARLVDLVGALDGSDPGEVAMFLEELMKLNLPECCVKVPTIHVHDEDMINDPTTKRNYRNGDKNILIFGSGDDDR